MTTNLFIGKDPRDAGEEEDIIADFSADNHIPLAWFLLFAPDQVVTRRSAFPERMMPEGELDMLDEGLIDRYQSDIVMFKTTTGQAAERLRNFASAFKKMPYIWSYFRVIDILEDQVDKALNPPDDEDDRWKVRSKRRYKETQRSHVKIKEELASSQFTVRQKDEEQAEDNPFSALEDLASDFETKVISDPSSTLSALNDPFIEKDDIDEEDFEASLADSLSELGGMFGDPDAAVTKEKSIDDDITDTLNEFGISERELFEALSADDDVEEEDDEIASLVLPSEKPIMVEFADLSDKINRVGRGHRFKKILEYFDRLLHHVIREESRTRVILEIMQDIFREGGTDWRPTGLLAEDFMREQVSRLSDLLLGSPSPFILIQENFDLEYWTSYTLQPGDERLMYKLSMLPSEEIHIALKNGKLQEIIDQSTVLLTATNQINATKITPEVMTRASAKSNIWGFRVLVRDSRGSLRPGTILNNDPTKSWEEDFKANLKIPSVRQDWNVTIALRLDEYLDEEPYTIEFKGAKSEDQAFLGYVRWLRRHQRLYWQNYGTDGTINMLTRTLLETADKALALQIFDLLNQLTEYGFNSAIEALNNESLINKITELYT